jgi:NADH:ubiquinone reductase (H+-translocating)
MTAAYAETRTREKLPPPNPALTQRKRVVIIGGGFAGIAAGRALKRCDAEVVLIDRRNHYIFQPLLYQVATATLAPAEIAAPIRQLAEKQKNLTVMLAEVTAVDLESRSVNVSFPTSGTHKIAFDFLIVAAGMQSSYFGHDEFARYAPGLKNLRDAETIRAKILGAYELAELTDAESERSRLMTFVLVGGGPSGVELAGSLAHMAKVTLHGNFRHIDPAKTSIVLIEGANRILPTFAEPLSKRVTRRLETLGIKVLTGTKVEIVDEQGVVAGGRRIPSATVLWTAGVAASPVLKTLGVPTDRAGRLSVDPFLRVSGTDGVFAVGDASILSQRGRPLPGVAQVAIQQGRYVGKVISRQIKGKAPQRPFRYFDKGNMAVVGRNFAILERGRIRTSGFMTWLVWVFIHIMFLPQLQNRLRVQRQWLWSYLTGQRGSRLILEPAGNGNQGSDVC